jgi:DNA polymerase-3 subunit delta'
MFSGPAGIGKLRVAQAMSAGALCAGEGNKPCGICDSCRQFAYGSHPDFLLVQPDGASLKIEQIRGIQHEAALAPYLSSRRVCIINDAETMTEQAANSLLKVLEEPPPGVIFILVTASPQLLPVTILSRCRQIRFQPLNYTQIEQLLVSQGVDAKQAALLARLSGGRLGLALKLGEPDGLAQREQALAIAFNLADADMNWVWQTLQQLDKLEHAEVLAVLQFLQYIFRDLALIAAGQVEQLLLNIDITGKLLTIGQNWPEQRVTAAYRELRAAQRALSGNANTRLTCEALLIKLTDLAKEGQMVW